MEGDEETRLWRRFIRFNQPDLDDPVNIIKDKYKNFKWSVTGIENVKYLEIKGKKPDEIIEYEINDQQLKRYKAYFVYFNDLTMDGNFDNMDITFD